MDSRSSTERVGSAARTSVIGTVVGAFAFFDGVFLGAPIALLAASFRPALVYAVATVVVILLVIACCSWVDRRWDDWFSGHGTRIEKRLEAMRASRLMSHPVAWIQNGSDRWYAFAAAVANPILIAALARFIGGKPIGTANPARGRRLRNPVRRDVDDRRLRPRRHAPRRIEAGSSLKRLQRSAGSVAVSTPSQRRRSCARVPSALS